MAAHEISRTIVSGNGVKVVRATCSCGNFKSEAKRLETTARRRQDREIAEHLLQATRDQLITIEREAPEPLQVSNFRALRVINDALGEIRTAP